MKKFALLLLSLVFLACSKDEEPKPEPVELSSENLITSFTLDFQGEVVAGNISEIYKHINFETVGKSLTSLTPTITYSDKASIEPAPGQPQDFSGPVIYTVTAENGDESEYRVLISNRPISQDNEISSFSFEINDETIETVIDQEADSIRATITFTEITSLVPSITLPEYASITPSPDEPQDFSAPVEYTVTAENSDTRTYVVSINEPVIDGMFDWIQGRNMYYTGVEAGIRGQFLSTEGSPKLYAEAGDFKVEFPLDRHTLNYADSHTGVPFYSIAFRVPESLPTGIYTLVFENNGHRATFKGFDVKAEEVPTPLSASQEVYERGDVLKIYGENLTARIAIPSNGSKYLLWNTWKFDITTNEARTEMTMTLDYHELFPSYYGREAQEKEIQFFDEEGRVGGSITVIFK